VLEIGVTIEQFDVSLSGQAVLVARWRIDSPTEKKFCTPAKVASRVVVQRPTPTLWCRRHLERPHRDLSRQLAQVLMALDLIAALAFLGIFRMHCWHPPAQDPSRPALYQGSAAHRIG